jgi:hypothetical protein
MAILVRSIVARGWPRLLAVLALLLACETTAPKLDRREPEIVAVSPNQLSGIVGAAVQPQPRVRVIDEGGRPIASHSLRFQVTGGNGTLRSADTLTDGNGEASAEWLLGQRVGENQLAVSLGSDRTRVLFTATSQPAAPAQIQAPERIEGVAFPGAAIDGITVRVTDAYGNVVPGSAVLFEVTRGDGRLPSGAASQWVTSVNGLVRLDGWVLGAPGPNTLVATLSDRGSVNFEVLALDSALITWFVASVRTPSGPPNEFKLALSETGHFVHEIWITGKDQPHRFAGTYHTNGDVLTLDGCGRPFEDSELVCNAWTGSISQNTVALSDLLYSRIMPDPVHPPGIYEAVDSPYYAGHGSRLASRYVLSGDGTFALQYASANYPFFEYRGTYEISGSTIQFLWEVVSSAGAWGATAVLEGDRIHVTYNIIMQGADFLNGTYVLKQ